MVIHIVRNINPVDAAEGFKPRPLGLGQFASVVLDFFDSILKTHLSLEVVDQLGITDGYSGLHA